MIQDMKGRICMVTGANSGIGRVAALELAQAGATVIMICRDKAEGEKARAQAIQSSGNTRVELMLCDLSSQRQIRLFASDYRTQHDRLHVLINNAAAVPREKTMTEDGIEAQLAVNHLAPFLLTNLLLDVIKHSAPSRIITVASGMYRTASLDFANLQGEKRYNAMKHYSLTKLLNIHFTYELARRLEGTGVTVNCLGPGFTATSLGRDFSPFSRLAMRLMGKRVEKGADTVIYLASSPEVETISGKYFENRKAIETSPPTYDAEISRRLWEISAKLVGGGF
jgi:NAD(P)-dependent dehydrogenase (short-subunit alcohol dehydrogenase family)